MYALVAVALVAAGTMAAHAHEPVTGWWVWVKHASSTEWVPFAPSADYLDCVMRQLPMAHRLVRAQIIADRNPDLVRPFDIFAPRFKCEEKS